MGGVDRRRFLAQLVAAGLTVSAAEALLAGATANAAVAAGTTLRLRANNDISNTDPAFWPTHIDEWCALSTMEGLVSFRTGTFNNVNCLAQSLEVAKDGLSVHFKLKQGVEFHGGYGEMTAADVKYSYERIAGLTKPNLHAVYQGDWNALQRVKTEGKYAGTIILKEKFAPLSRSTMPAGAGLVVSQKAVQKLGKKFGTHPIGTGPYEFVSWSPKQKIVLKRFDKYAGGQQGLRARTVLRGDQHPPDRERQRGGDGSARRRCRLRRDRHGLRGSLQVGLALQLGVAQHARLPVHGHQCDGPAAQGSQPAARDPRRIDVPSIITAAFDGKYQRANSLSLRGCRPASGRARPSTTATSTRPRRSSQGGLASPSSSSRSRHHGRGEDGGRDRAGQPRGHRPRRLARQLADGNASRHAHAREPALLHELRHGARSLLDRLVHCAARICST